MTERQTSILTWIRKDNELKKIKENKMKKEINEKFIEGLK